MSHTEPTNEQLANLYAGGLGIVGIAQETGIGRETVRKRLISSGVQMRPSSRAGISAEESQSMQALHHEGLSYADIGREIGRDPSTVSKHLHALFPDLRPLTQPKNVEPAVSDPLFSDSPTFVPSSDDNGKVFRAREHPAHQVQLLEQISYWRSHAEHYRTRAQVAELSYPLRISPAKARRIADRLHDLADQLEPTKPRKAHHDATAR